MKNTKYIGNILIFIISIFLCLILLNFVIFFSNKFINQKYISKNLLTKLPIEQTFLYADTFNKLEKVNVILGDSNAFGSGDAFLSDEYNYSIGHFLFNQFKQKKNFINIAQPGSSSQKNYINYLNFKKKFNIKPDKIIYLFYEGNDLQDDLLYLNNYNNIIKIKNVIRYYLPLITLIQKLIGDLIYSKINKKIELLNLNLQSPPIELNKKEINISLNILFNTLTKLQKDTRDIILVYIPSPTITLDLQNPVVVEKYFQTNISNFTYSEESELISKLIKLEIKNFSMNHNLKFIDMTDILKKKSLELKIYGPKDYSHFNKNGYEVISHEIYKNY
tara:strand:- start:123 stop:1121 length:999 start_codon:yes stop_codon:yes gene_type:complete